MQAMKQVSLNLFLDECVLLLMVSRDRVVRTTGSDFSLLLSSGVYWRVITEMGQALNRDIVGGRIVDASWWVDTNSVSFEHAGRHSHESCVASCKSCIQFPFPFFPPNTPNSG